MTDLVFLEPAQRELEEIAKIHTNLADQIPQKKFNEPDSGYAFRFGTVSAARTYPAGLPSFTLASFWRPARWSHLNRRQVPYQERSASARGALRPGFDSLFFCSTKKKRLPFQDAVFFVERAKGIEPSTQAWEARILPLNYARICGRRSRPTILYYLLFKTSTTLAGILRHFSSEMDASETRRPMASGTRKIPSASSSRLAEAGSSQGIDAKNPPS